jgi:hypothetical protein
VPSQLGVDYNAALLETDPRGWDRLDRPVAGASDLYRALLDAWNRHDARAYAALFTDDGYVVGFDGSEMDGRDEVERSLSAIFADRNRQIRREGQIRTNGFRRGGCC